MEQFLEQSTQAEDSFYRMEEQRLQAEDSRREAEHTREMHMLQMLGQMFSSISSGRSAGIPTRTPPASAAVFHSGSQSSAHGKSSHVSCPTPQKDCFSQQGQLLNPDPQSLGISFGVVCAALIWNGWKMKEKL